MRTDNYIQRTDDLVLSSDVVHSEDGGGQFLWNVGTPLITLHIFTTRKTVHIFRDVKSSSRKNYIITTLFTFWNKRVEMMQKFVIFILI